MNRYRKWGRSVRREGQRRIAVDEAGEAFEDGSAFRARFLDERRDLPAPDAQAVETAAREIESMIAKPLALERMIVSEGIVEHQAGDIVWRETARRVHLSITNATLRVLIDLAGFETHGIRPVIDALRNAGQERPAPRRVRIAGAVGAALLPSLDISMTQSAAPHDGNGQPIVERPVASVTPPNWFRPTYRLPPRRAWFHLRVGAFGEIDPEVPQAIALLAPVQKRIARVLCVDRGGIYPTTLELGRVLAARPMPEWYPYGAGAFGAELMF